MVPTRRLVTLVVLAVLLGSACAGGGGSSPASHGRRIDRAIPSFSDPTTITHPLFPATRAHQVIQLGREGKAALRVEVTTLRGTRPIRWRGRDVETVVSQFLAYSDGRILELARDHYAQADDGSVWYFGEDVFNYDHGVVKDTKGSWLAGRDGPPGMIMPPHPRVGDVYHSENIPGLVFEKDTVQRTGVAVQGPRGRVGGAIAIEEQPMGEGPEHKLFAPGYGEFRAAAAGELVHVALAVPIDGARAPEPPQLATLERSVDAAFSAGRAGAWPAARSASASAAAAWRDLRPGTVPPRLRSATTRALVALRRSIARSEPGAAAAALAATTTVLDLALQYRPVAAVDQARLSVLERRVLLDREAGDAGAVAGDRTVIDAIRARM
jgi:hypothetical protein